jgi:two-component system response regulator DesR
VIKIVLAEDQALVRGAIAALLRLEGDIEIVAECGDGRSALGAVVDYQPDVVVADIEMPQMTGLELAQQLHDKDLPARMVILTTFARPGYLRRALDAGVRGYLLKDSPASRLADAIRSVHRGGRAIDPELAVEAWSEEDPLTDRERLVLRLAGDRHETVLNYRCELSASP